MKKNVALITGASSGIGRSIALSFAKAGYQLALCCHSKREQLEAVGKECHALNPVAPLLSCFDIGNYEDTAHFISSVLETFGQIDVLINNAGISYIGTIDSMTVEGWNSVLSTNLSGVFYTSKSVIPSMVHRKKGHIINISSVWGEKGASCEVAYSATKGGLNSFTKSLAKELAPSNIAVNAVACGLIQTAMNQHLSQDELHDIIEEIPSGRMGTTEEVADLVLQLAQQSSYLTGQIITLDGGWI